MRKYDVIILDLLYIYIPIIIFIIGWCKSYIAITCIAVLLYNVFFMFKEFTRNNDSKYKKLTFHTFDIIVLFLIICVVYLLGWGRYTEQTWDWYKHNTILSDLINRSWPVYYNSEGAENAMLTYYIAQYLVPSGIGKLFHSVRIAEIANALWAFIGVILAYINLLFYCNCKLNARNKIIVILLFFLFACPTEFVHRICYKIVPDFYGFHDYASFCHGIILQYSSNTTLLSWVYPQVINAWIISLLFLNYYKKVDYYVPLMLPMLLYGSFSFIGLLILAIPIVLYLVKQEGIKRIFIKILSIHNITNTLFIGTVLILYFWGNVGSQKTNDLEFHLISWGHNYIIYFVFIGINVLLYSSLIFKYYKHNIFYFSSIITLCIIPLFHMGLVNDFVMRSSIPALFILDCLIIRIVCKEFNHIFCRKNFTLIILIGLLAISARNEIYFYLSQAKNDKIMELSEYKTYGTMEKFADRNNKEIRDDMRFNYFTYDVDNSFFYKYLAR